MTAIVDLDIGKILGVVVGRLLDGAWLLKCQLCRLQLLRRPVEDGHYSLIRYADALALEGL